MSWLLMADMTPAERERYVDEVLLNGGFPAQPSAPEESDPGL
jgi:hypothetical protein